MLWKPFPYPKKNIPVPQNHSRTPKNHSRTPKTISIPPNQDITNFFYLSGLLMASLGNEHFPPKKQRQSGIMGLLES